MSKSKLTDRQRFWLEHLELAESRGQKLVDYAREHDLEASSLYAYRAYFKRRRQTTAAAPFVKAIPARDAEVVRIELPNGIVLSMTGTVDLAALVTALQGAH